MLSLKGVPMENIEKSFGFEIEDTNGYDLDWSAEFTHDGKDYEIWGSGRRGSANIILKD